MGPPRQEALYHAVCSNLGTGLFLAGYLLGHLPWATLRIEITLYCTRYIYMERARTNLQFKRSLDLEGEWCQVLDVTVGAPRGVKKRQFGVQQRLNDSFFFRSWSKPIPVMLAIRQWMCSMGLQRWSNSKHSWKKKSPETKETYCMHKVYLPSMSTSLYDLSTILCLLSLFVYLAEPRVGHVVQLCFSTQFSWCLVLIWA